ncbi:hypothetical protein ACQR1H_14960 [Bradyrhizobium sp. HKCCYLRH2015]|uniref:hypothetical protein n=1 Tax=Bradyrhizobium sp. HKCCYLRH2015 TaxID=3420742 RepID=UPI003EBF96D1
MMGLFPVRRRTRSVGFSQREILASNGPDTADVQCNLKAETINIRYLPSPDLRFCNGWRQGQRSMYLLLAYAILIVVSAKISSRWAWNLFREYELASPSKRLAVRRRAVLPALCVGGLGLLVVLLVRVSGPELGTILVNALLVIVSIFSGLLIGIIGAVGTHQN